MRPNLPAAAISSDSLVPKKRTSYIKTGLGGAGNFRPKPDIFVTTRTAQPPLIPSLSSRRFSTGIGGVGNCREFNDRPAFGSKEEDFRARVRGDHASVSFHHGRGGFGNRTVRQESQDSINTTSSTDSNQSDHSSITRDTIRGPFARLNAHFHALD